MMLLRSSVSAFRSVATVFCCIALAAPLYAATGTPKTVSREEFRSDVVRLQSLMKNCAQDSNLCDAEQVGDDLQVGNPTVKDASETGFVQHWNWLRDSLSAAKMAKPQDRAKILQDASDQLAELAAESSPQTASQAEEFHRARSKADSILNTPEFEAVQGPNWLQRQKIKLVGWIWKFFSGLDRLGSAAPWLGKVLEWLLFIAAVAGLLVLILRGLARQRLRVALGADAAAATTPWDREATDWLQQADAFAAGALWRDAVHCVYWAAIVSLEARRTWRHDPTRTPREYVRLLAAGSPQQQGLRGLTQIFERVWYGVRETNAEEYERARSFYNALAAGLSQTAAAPSTTTRAEATA